MDTKINYHNCTVCNSKNTVHILTTEYYGHIRYSVCKCTNCKHQHTIFDLFDMYKNLS